MVRKYIIILGLIMLFASTVPVFGQSDTNKGTESGSPNSNLSQSELSSSTGRPFVIIGYAYLGEGMWDCVKGTPCKTQASISWYGSVPSGNAPTTLTVIFSSTPPGPLQFSFDDRTWITVDNSNPVYNNSSGYADPKATTIYLQTYGYWSPPSGAAYPWLQWAPTSVTLIYQ